MQLFKKAEAELNLIEEYKRQDEPENDLVVKVDSLPDLSAIEIPITNQEELAVPSIWRKCLTKLQRTKTHLTICLSLCFCVLGMFISALGPALFYVQQNTDASLSQIAFLTTSRSIGYFIGSMVGGPIFDKFNGNRALSASMFLALIGNILIPLMTNLYAVNVLVSSVGFALGVLDTGGIVTVIWLYGDRAGPYMQTLSSAFGLGAFLSPVIIGQVMDATKEDPTWGFWALSAFSLPFCLWLMSYKCVKGQRSDAEIKMSSIGRYEIAVIILSALFVLMMVGIEITGSTYFAEFAVESGLTDTTHAAYLVSLFWVGLTLSTLAAIPLAIRFKPSQLLGFNLVGATLTMVIWTVCHETILRVYVMWIGTFLLGMFVGSGFPTLMSLAETYVDLSGKRTTCIIIGATFGEMTIPLMSGNLFDMFGPDAILWILVGCTVSALVIYLILIKVGTEKRHTSSKGEDSASQDNTQSESGRSSQESDRSTQTSESGRNSYELEVIVKSE